VTHRLGTSGLDDRWSGLSSGVGIAPFTDTSRTVVPPVSLTGSFSSLGIKLPTHRAVLRSRTRGTVPPRSLFLFHGVIIRPTWKDSISVYIYCHDKFLS
jgi:hypothetical protein